MDIKPAILCAVMFLAACDELDRMDATNNEAVRLGQNIYVENCAICHGLNLEGQPNWRSTKDDGTLPAPPHDDSGHTWHHDDQLLFNYTKGGGAAIAPAGFKSGMPGFEDSLTDEQIWQVLSYIKSRWSPQNQARQERLTQR
ncbi:c-type cytochrome [Magnetovibrio sp. PR-2]|uniref:c-type cytochrome n=1 Tax=Magnetovibrio sp. PR-2 TaxID=3120356 RepID=UPI002FCE4313